jgi:hypothetical protein
MTTIKIIGLFVLFMTMTARAEEVSYPFAIPKEATGIKVDSSNKTWNMTGMLCLPFEKAEALFKKNIELDKFQFMHDIPFESPKKKKLLAWKKGADRLILFIWEIDENKTGFAWGLSKE